MQNGLVYLRPSRLAYVRVTGAYETSIPAAWTKLLTWIDRNGVGSVLGRGFGLARDNPLIVAAERCRYDACIEVEPLFEERARRELGVLTLPAGPYVRKREIGNYDAIVSFVAIRHSTFVAPTGLRLDDNRPLVTVYLDDPRRLEPKDLRADICVPVATGAGRARMASSLAAA